MPIRRAWRQTVWLTNMEERKASLGPVGGTFSYKILSDGSLDKSIVVCIFCGKEFAYHRSTSSLRYHLNAKHFAASIESSASITANPGSNRRCRRSRLDQFAEFGARMGKSVTHKLTNSVALCWTSRLHSATDMLNVQFASLLIPYSITEHVFKTLKFTQSH